MLIRFLARVPLDRDPQKGCSSQRRGDPQALGGTDGLHCTWAGSWRKYLSSALKYLREEIVHWAGVLDTRAHVVSVDNPDLSLRLEQNESEKNHFSLASKFLTISPLKGQCPATPS